MNLPSYWRRASFAVSEAAELIGVSEDALRTWLARAPFNDFAGAKASNGRLFLSCQDMFFYLLVRDLSRFGVPVRTAMLEASLIANGATEGLPRDEQLVVRHRAPGTVSFELIDDPDFTADSAMVMPLRSLAVALIERAAIVYSKDAA